jgi:hypothetical protein
MVETFVFATAMYWFLHATFKRNIALKLGSSKHGNIFLAYAAAENVVAIFLKIFFHYINFIEVKNVTDTFFFEIVHSLCNIIVICAHI